jgi:predicted ferric reductase
VTSPPRRFARLRGLPFGALATLYVVLGLLPLGVATLEGLPRGNAWRELSNGLAMVAFAMMLMQFLLSGRFRPITGKAGIDRTMRFHQLLPWAILIFLFLHPFLYAVPRLSPDPSAALATVQRMFLSGGLRTGVIAWLLLIALVMMGVWRDRLPMRYELWRLSHGVGAGAIAVLGAQHTLGVGSYSADARLAGFWLILTGLALLSLAYVYVMKPLMQLRSPYRVVANEKVAERMWQISVEPRSGPAIEFVAGQFVWLNLGHSPFSLTEHPFSISSAPAERPQIGFTIKESGDFTNRIGEVAPGTTAYLDGPHGNFSLEGRAARRLVFIAGGVGFAPVMGMLRQLKAERWPHPILLIYGNRVETQILYRQELETMRRELTLDVRLVLSEPPLGWTGLIGELTPEVLSRALGSIDREALYFVCGPPPMMNSVERALERFGVPGRHVVTERFKYS